MKRIFFLSFLFFLFINATAQQSDRKQPAIGLHFVLLDFKTAGNIKANGIGDIFKADIKMMKQGLSFGYINGLTNHIDFSINTSGCFVDYSIPGQLHFDENSLLLQLTGMVNLKLNNDKNWFTPLLTAGAGVSKYRSYYSVFIPAGVGLQANFKQDIFCLLTYQYIIPLTNKLSSQFYYSLGIAGNISRRKTVKQKIQVHTVPSLPSDLQINMDRDGDGVIDKDDRCPDVPGLQSLQGCPDMDGDNIADMDDKCPAVAGIARYQGCPIPDTDNDGINDEQDSCINNPGPLSNNGCPIVEKDLKEKINLASQSIFFSTGSDVLLPKSFEALNEIAKILVANPTYKVSIEGHTDNTGRRANNQQLSENRAKAVMAYLMGKEVNKNRMESKGFGKDQPLTENKTTKGRSINRRVEIKIN